MTVDPTDLEPSTFLAKQAVRSVARLATAAVGVGRARVRRQELDQLLSTPTFIEELTPYEDELRTGDSAAIVEFLSGDEVERLLQWVAALQVTDKWDAQSEASLVGRLSGGILRYTQHVSVDLARAIAGHVGRQISANVSEALGSTGALEADLTPKAKSVLAKNATLVSRISLNESSIFNDLTDKAAADHYIDSLLRSVQQATTKSKMPHLGNLKRVTLADLYVAPAAQHYQLTRSDRTRNIGDIISVGSEVHRTVILGDPGGGKTTTSRRLMNLFSEHQLQRKTDRSIALMIVLRDWATELSSGEMTVVEVLRRESATRHSLEAPAGVLEEMLESGRVKVFFDGLDELLDTADRNRVVDVVEGFVHRFPLVPVVVTSRRVGYPQAPLDGDLFAVVEISSFNPEQRNDYVSRWFALEDDLHEDERTQRTDSFIRETGNLNDIASNPLMLSLMCALYSYDQYIPRNRPEVYEKCSRLMFDSWDRDRGIRPTLSFQSHMMGALDSLALFMFGKGLNETGLTRALLVKKLAKYLKGRRFRTADEAHAAAADFVDHCSGRAWILSEVSPERYTFTHATFIEYFAARQLIRSAKSPKSLASEIREKVVAAEWDVVCQLSVQIIDQTEIDGSDKVVRSLLKSTSETQAQEVNTLSFVLRCFAFYVPSPRTLDAVAARVVTLFGGQSKSDFEGVGSPIPTVLEVGSEIRHEWHLALFKRIKEVGSDEASPALRALVVAPPNGFFSAKHDVRDDWLSTVEAVREDWRVAGERAHLWCVLAGPMSERAVLTVIDHHGVSSLFADAPMGANSYYLAFAARILRYPDSFERSALITFSERVLDAARTNAMPSPTETLGLGPQLSQDDRQDLETTDPIQRTAMLLAGMGLLELAEETRGLSRRRIVSRIFSGGEASLEGGSLKPVVELGLQEGVRQYVEAWMNGDVNLFSSEPQQS